MKTLKIGDQSAEVKRLQRRLRELHFSPGTIDGDFGPATRAAVIGFQNSSGLLADGIVGPRTAYALGLIEEQGINSILPSVTTTLVSRMFPFTQVDNIKTNLPFVLQSLVDFGLTEQPMVLMALSTIRAETESFRPISEYKSKYNTSPGGHPFDLYDRRADLGNSRKGHGEKYRGRGFIQLTGKFNYEKFGPRVGLGRRLSSDPDLANQPKHAAALLSVFLKDKEMPIKEALLYGELATARRLVNGGVHGLHRFTQTFELGESLLADV